MATSNTTLGFTPGGITNVRDTCNRAGLARQGVEHELLTVAGAGHGLAGARPAAVAEAQDRAVAFVARFLR